MNALCPEDFIEPSRLYRIPKLNWTQGVLSRQNVHSFNMAINFQRARKGTRVVTVEDSPFDTKSVHYGFGFDDKSQKGALVFTEQKIDMIRPTVIGDVVEENTVIIFVNSMAAISKLEYTIARLKQKLTNEARLSNDIQSGRG